MKSATSSSIGTLGEKISFVTLDNIIGKPGEQGEAWKAHSNSHTTLNFAVKIGRIPLKVLPKNGTAKLEEFRKEFDMLAKLNHPNIIKVYHYGGYKKNSKVYPFYIMEYLGDNVKTLTAYLKDLINPAEKRRLCLNVFFDISDALKHLHIKHHGVHSDIKESNILIATDYDKNVNIKLIDFGFARVLGAAEASEDRLGRIGRVPQKPSSLPRVAPCKTVHHMDIWQLCQTISRNLSHKPIEVNEATELWPIDYADFPLLIGLIKDWASDAPASAPETDTIENFFNKVDALRCRVKPKYCDADLRGSLRFLSIPEVATAVKCKVAEHAIRIPPRRLVVYTDRISKLLACNEMTRLGNTRQLGFTHLVYPGAQGTRLEHSLGVYELACHFVARMSSHPIFRRICGDSRDCLLFVLAALLHDAGHFPFAHQLEEFRKDNFSADQWRNIHKLLDGGHEKRTCEIIKDNLSALLKEHFNLSEGEIDRLLLLIKKVRNGSEDAKTLDADPGLRFLKSIINHPVDIDKLDYIERDAYHCGVPYGNYIDVDRIFETMRLIPDNNNGAYLAFDQRGVGCIESLVTARHQLYANVYWHRAVRSATAMFKHLFFLFQAEVNDEDVIEKIFLESGSDLACLRLLEEHAENNMVDSVAKKAILHFARVVSGRERALYKAVVQREHTDQYQIEYGTIQYQNQRLKALDIYNTIKEEKLWNTQAEDLGEHNILIDCRADNWPDFESIRTITPLGKEEPLSTVAATVRELKTSFVKQACRIRVFINTNSLKPQYQDKIGRRKVEEVIAAKMEGAGMGT